MQIALDTAECCNAAASHCCHPLTISSPVGNQMWPVCHVCLFRPWWTADKWTRIADTDIKISPRCVGSLFAFERPFGDWCWNQTVTRLCLRGTARIHLSPSSPTESAALGPQGNDIMRFSMPTLRLISIVNAAHTLHFGPVMVALWAALKMWQSIMFAQCAASLFTAASCNWFQRDLCLLPVLRMLES